MLGAENPRFPLSPSFAISKKRLLVGMQLDILKQGIDVQDAGGVPITDAADFKNVRGHVAARVTSLSYANVKGNFSASYQAIQTMAPMIGQMTGTDLGDLLVALPDAEVITPYLFGCVSARSFDGEGILFESYGPDGGIALIGGGNSYAMTSIGGVGIAAGFMLPALSKAQEAARRTACLNNTRQVGLALFQYAGDHDDAFPESLGALLKEGYLKNPKVFVCPSSARRAVARGFPEGDFTKIDAAQLAKFDELGDYVLVKGISHADRPDWIILHEKDGAHHGEGRNCFYNDGHVQWLSEVEFQKAMAAQRGKTEQKE